MAEEILFPHNLAYRQTDIRADISNYRVTSLLKKLNKTRMTISMKARLNKSDDQTNGHTQIYRVSSYLVFNKKGLKSIGQF